MVLVNLTRREVASKYIKEDLLLRSGPATSKSFTDKNGLRYILDNNFRNFGHGETWGDVDMKEIVREIPEVSLTKLMSSNKATVEGLDVDYSIEQTSDEILEQWAKEFSMGIRLNTSTLKSNVYKDKSWGSIKIFSDEEGGYVKETDLLVDRSHKVKRNRDRELANKSRIASLMKELYQMSRVDGICILGLVCISARMKITGVKTKNFSFRGTFLNHRDLIGSYVVNQDALSHIPADNLNTDKKWRMYLSAIFEPDKIEKEAQHKSEFFKKINYCADTLLKTLQDARLLTKFSQLTLHDFTWRNIYSMNTVQVDNNDIVLLNSNIDLNVIKCLESQLSYNKALNKVISKSVGDIIVDTVTRFRRYVLPLQMYKSLFKDYRLHGTLETLLNYYCEVKGLPKDYFNGFSFIDGIYRKPNFDPFIFDGVVFSSKLKLTPGYQLCGVILTSDSALISIDGDDKYVKFKSIDHMEQSKDFIWAQSG